MEKYKEKILSYKQSSKPLLITLRDSMYLSMIMVGVYLIMLIFYYILFSKPILSKDNLVGAVKTFGIAICSQLIYEYSGYNAMIGESSIRYSKGSTLSKYTSRRHAILHTIYAQRYVKLANDNDRQKMKRNMMILSLLISQPNTLYKINTMYADHTNYDLLSILKEINKTNNHITMEELKAIISVPAEMLKEISFILKKLDEDIIEDILENGFADYKVKTNNTLLTQIEDFGDIRLSPRIGEKIKRIKLAKLDRLKADLQNMTEDDIVIEYGSREDLIDKIENISSSYTSH